MNPASPRRLVGATDYETWVLTLKAWADAPEQVPLDHLPPLNDDTFTPQTFERLLSHVTAALEAVTARWRDQLARALKDCSSPHDLARELVQLRSSLARRRQLTSHPSLPPIWREAFTRESQSLIARLQDELERGVRQGLESSPTNRAHKEQLLRVVRENPFTRALEFDVRHQGRQEAAPLAEVEAPLATDPADRFRHRRTLNPL